ncbi:annexin D5-like protein [Tanacetum coccineum]
MPAMAASKPPSSSCRRSVQQNQPVTQPCPASDSLSVGVFERDGVLSSSWPFILLAFMHPLAQGKTMSMLQTRGSSVVASLCATASFANISIRSHAKGQLLLANISIPRSEGPEFDRLLVDQDARALYKAGEKRWGTDETTFRSIFSERSRVHLAAVNSTYKIMYGNTLRKGKILPFYPLHS